VSNTSRPTADIDRDVNRKPAEVIEFFGIEPGMNVLDIFAGGGYYTEILNYVVGEEGSVTLYNNGGWDGYVGSGVAERLNNNRLPNVVNLVAEANEVIFAPASYDAAMFVLGFHDLYYVDVGWPAIDAADFLDSIYAGLKAGGIMGIVDHAAELGANVEVANTLHRIDPEKIQSDMELAGFVFEAESMLLRNTDDDRSNPMSDLSVSGKTDRVVYLYRKPQ
jgi:predicted methyltransferase